MNTPITHHASNAAIVAVPVVSWWQHAPEIVTVGAGVMAFFYYLIFIVEKLVNWRAKWLQIRQSANRVAVAAKEKSNAAVDSDHPAAH